MTGSDCKESIDSLLAYLEGELPEDVRRRVEAHLAACPPCEAVLNSYRETPELCRKALGCSMSQRLVSKLRDFLRCETAKKPQ